jgi:hypothetical protein
MAKSKNANGTPGKMTVMLFQLEGDNATLQDGLRTITAAVSRVIPAGGRAALQSAVAGLPAPASESETTGDDDVPELVDVAATQPEAVRPAARSFRSPTVLDIDLNNPSLSEFLAPHADQSVNRRYLLAAYWLKAHRDIPEVSMDHIHTCFRHMDWDTPKSAAQPLRDMKSADGWFHKGEQKGHYKINHVGENEVQRIVRGER